MRTDVPCSNFKPTSDPDDGGVVCANCGYSKSSHR
jgi:hypothetical protein